MTKMIAMVRGSLLGKILAGGLGAVLVLGVAWHVVGRILHERESRDLALEERALETELAMLQVRRSEKDALLRDVRSPEFFQTGKATYLGKHEEALANLHACITELRRWSDEVGTQIPVLEKHVDAYAAGFHHLMDARRELGFSIFGLIGRLRRAQLDLAGLADEDSERPLRDALGAVGRAATEYLLFEQDAAGRELGAAVESALSMVRARGDAERNSALSATLEGLRQTNGMILELQGRIGLSEEQGFRGEMRTAIHALTPLLQEIRSIAHALAEDARSTQHMASIVLLLAGLLGAGLVFFFYARSITRPVGQLRHAAQALGEGKLDTVVELASNDEIGGLAAAFRAMAENLRRAEAERGQIFQGITETTSRLAAASSEILASTTQQSAGAEEQAAAVSQTVATIDEVLHAAEEGASRATEVSEASRRSVDNSRTGTQSVEATLERMRKVKERSEELSAGILDLDSRAESIGVIIATVNDIAEQTNLLALNAAIEASRAGEHGRGFAVVAAEVRSLADECKKATAQVRDILGEVQRATRMAVTRTRESVEGANEAMASAEKTGEAIESLEVALSGQSQAAAQINASARQQAIGIKQINEAMRSIDQVTRQNVDSNRQTQRAMQDLSALGDRLRKLVGSNGQEI